MDLILWRHADAEALVGPGAVDHSQQQDLDRPLTAKGFRQAARVSLWIKKRLDPNARILSSPSLRTRQTGSFLGESEVEDLLYKGSPEKILEVINWPQLSETIVLVGHQPTLGRMASLILTGDEYPLVIEKGALWWVRWKKGAGGGCPVLVSAISPEFLMGHHF